MIYTVSKSTLLLLGLLSLPAVGDITTGHMDQKSGSAPVKKAQIGEIAANWLDEHPKFLNATPESLRQQQQVQQQMQQALILQNRAVLLDGSTPSVGPKNAAAAVVMFFDYQCISCSKMAPILAKLRQDNPDVRFIFREYPIFAARWPVSSYAARVGEAVWAIKGGDAYLHYHNSIFGSQKVGGKLTTEDVSNAAQPYLNKQQIALAEETSTQGELHNKIYKNIELGSELLLSGIPAIIVLPVNGYRENSLSVMSYTSSEEALRQAILKAKSGASSQ
ncbi:Protein-disulfide isomerase [Serratia fonticola]|nr:Protein-disulfide isomerase [Serratia fonticola]